MNSFFVCPDPVKEVNSEMMNHSSSLSSKVDLPHSTRQEQAAFSALASNGTTAGEVAAAGGLKQFRKCWARRQGEAGQRWAMR